MSWQVGHEELDPLLELILLKEDGCLTPWERKFIRSAASDYRREYSLSPGQKDKLAEIYKKAFKDEQEGNAHES